MAFGWYARLTRWSWCLVSDCRRWIIMLHLGCRGRWVDRNSMQIFSGFHNSKFTTHHSPIYSPLAHHLLTIHAPWNHYNTTLKRFQDSRVLSRWQNLATVSRLVFTEVLNCYMPSFVELSNFHHMPGFPTLNGSTSNNRRRCTDAAWPRKRWRCFQRRKLGTGMAGMASMAQVMGHISYSTHIGRPFFWGGIQWLWATMKPHGFIYWKIAGLLIWATKLGTR